MQDVVSLYLVFSPGVSLYVEALFSAGMRGIRSRSELSAVDDRIREEPWPETGETMKKNTGSVATDTPCVSFFLGKFFDRGKCFVAYVVFDLAGIGLGDLGIHAD